MRRASPPAPELVVPEGNFEIEERVRAAAHTLSRR